MAATPSEINALIAQARCIDCYPAPIQSEIQTYIMAVVAGTTLDPLALAKLAKCMTCLSTDTLLRIKAYLLARISGPNVRPETLIDDSQCYECVPEGFLQNIETYKLLNDPQSPSTNAAVISRLARCYGCLSPQTLLEVQVYLLALIARLDPDPNTLAEESNVIAEIPVTIIRRVITREIVDLEDGGGGLAGCVDVPADLIPVITVNYVAGVASTIDVLFPKVCCQPNSFTVYESNNADMSASVDLDVIPMAGATPGEENFTVAGVDVSGATRTYLAVKQNCLDGTVSDYSNIEPRFSGAAIASDWADRVETNGGVRPSQNNIDAAAQFVMDLMIAAVWNKMVAINMFAPDNLTAAITPLLVGPGLDPWTNNNFIAGDLTVNGLIGNGANKYLNTGVNPSTELTLNSVGLVVYTTWATSGVVGYEYIGAYTDASNNCRFNNFNSTEVWDCYNSGFGRITAPGLAQTAYRSSQRTGAAATAMYQANSVNPHALVSSGILASGSSPPNLDIYCMALNQAGVATQHVVTRFSFAAITEGLTQAEDSDLFDAVQALRTTFGGGFA